MATHGCAACVCWWLLAPGLPEQGQLSCLLAAAHSMPLPSTPRIQSQGLLEGTVPEASGGKVNFMIGTGGVTLCTSCSHTQVPKNIQQNRLWPVHVHAVSIWWRATKWQGLTCGCDCADWVACAPCVAWNGWSHSCPGCCKHPTKLRPSGVTKDRECETFDCPENSKYILLQALHLLLTA